jgi:Bacterial membrane protein YfhO
MNSPLLKKALPHLIAIVVFLIVSIAYNKTALEQKVLRQADVQGYTGMAKQSNDYREKYGHWPLWTESMFGGMPAYNIAIEGTSAVNVLINKLNWIFYLGKVPLKPISFFFSACICFYILTQVLELSLLISLLGSIAYAYATFNMILVAVGHDTELIAIGYMPAVIAGVLLILRGKYLFGTALMTGFFTLEVSIQHLQIVYYTGLIIGIIALVYLITNWKEKKLRHFLISYFLIGISLVIGLLNYAFTLLPTKELVTETMRGGKSQLSTANIQNKTKGGLNKDYAFQWSYGISETLTLFVPGMQGGGSAGKEITGDSKFVDKLTEVGWPEENALEMASSKAYWGDQPYTGGPVYLGAVICFLFIMGMVYVKSWHKWWILSICLVGIVMAWGRHFAVVNYFLFDYLPLYSKFRAPSMALVMPQLGFALLAVLGLQQFIDSTEKKENQLKKFKEVLYISGGLVFLSILIYMMSDFKSDNDNRMKDSFVSNIIQQQSQGKQPSPEMQQQANQMVSSWISALHEDRKGIFQADLIRSTVLILLAAGLCWFYFKGKIKSTILLSGLLVLSSFDLMAEGRKYLSEDSYTEPENIDASFALTDADNQINADPEKNFRVLDIASGDPFQDSRASYFHNSVGGYHPAKLALYNDLIERQLVKGNQMVYNMLNTKYVIRKGPGGKVEAIVNNGAFGSCWLVSDIHFVDNADQEMAALDSINVRDTAIVENNFRNKIPFMPVKDSTASVQLIENLNDKISYKFKSKTNQFVVFSEVYYDKGWNAFIDGNPAPYCKVDYVLRGMSVPAGDHTIEFRFEPNSYILGNRITGWAAILTFLLLITAIAKWVSEIIKENKAQSLKAKG